MGASDGKQCLRLEAAARFPYAPAEYCGRIGWKLLQALLLRFVPARLHWWHRFWYCRFGARIGRSGISPSASVVHPWLLSVGDASMIGPRVTIYNLGPVSIGNQTVISQDAYVCAGSHDYTSRYMPLLRPPICIGSNVWICAGAFIGPGVTVGDGAVVGARAVVMHDVPPWTVVAGNPAKVLKRRELRSEGED